MIALQTYLLTYALNALWQVPLITLTATLIASLAAHLTPSNPALARHRVWVGALFLQVVLPVCNFASFIPLFLSRALHALYSAGQTTHIDISYVTVLAAPETATLPEFALLILTSAYLLSVLYFFIRLIHGLLKTRELLAESIDLPLDVPCLPNVRIGTSPSLSGPVTLGIRRPVLLLPSIFLESTTPQDRQALFSHESAHVRRHDFALNLLYLFITLPIAFHPALWFTRARLAETREMICDTLAAQSLSPFGSYTTSLLRLALTLTPTRQPSPIHAIGFLDAHSFERRLMNLSQLTSTPIVLSRSRRIVLAFTCTILAVAASASALALHISAPMPAGQVHLTGAQQAGRSTYKQPPVYPAEAKANHDTLDGPVILHVLIGKDGSVSSIEVRQSLREDYDRSALEAVRNWRWEPFLIDGAPTEVDTEVTVNYSIDHSQDPK